MNGYTQIAVGDKLRGFKWGKYAFEKYMRMLNLKPEEDVTGILNSKLNAEHSAIILYCGLSMNCFIKQQEPDFSFEDCVEWDELLPAEEQAKINEAVEQCAWFKNFNEDIKKKTSELERLVQKNGGREKKRK